MNEESLEEAARAIAEKASEPGTFSFVDRLLGRNYPTEEVRVFLDEALGYEMVKLREKAVATKDPDEAIKLEDEIAAIDAKLNQDVATFVLQGTTNEVYDAMVKEAYEQYPAEYEESTNPFSGRKEKTEIEDEARQHFLQNVVWAKFVKEIRAADGTQMGVTEAEASVIRGALPIAGIMRVQEVIQKLRMATNWMDHVQDEGFLAGP